MAKIRGVEAKLNRLRALRHDPTSSAMIAEVGTALEDASAPVVAVAAEIAGERALVSLVPRLATAFDRFMNEPELDKACRAKILIVEALNKLDGATEEVFLRGLYHVEASLDGQDSAAPLRGNCALGLVRLRHADVLFFLADLLLDRAKVARIAAAQALGASGLHAALPLLRYKARLRDEPEVIVECLTAMLNIDADKTLPFVTQFLQRASEPVQEGIILALAESRRPEVLDILRDFWPRTRRGPLEEVVFLACAMLRVQPALDFLLEALADRNQITAHAALQALAVHRHNAKLKERIAVILAEKGVPTLLARFKEKFADGSA